MMNEQGVEAYPVADCAECGERTQLCYDGDMCVWCFIEMLAAEEV